jgi:predicted nucleic acid-binding protein
VTLCVIDASVALAWSFKDEVSPYATFIVRSVKNAQAVAPIIWPLELNNALISAVRRERIDALVADRIRNTLDQLPVDIDSGIAVASLGQRILRLGIEHGLSAYDASYRELAMRRGLPLATQDERLLRAAGAAGIEILQP